MFQIWTRSCTPHTSTEISSRCKVSACAGGFVRNVRGGRIPRKAFVTGAELGTLLPPLEQSFQPVLDPSIAIAAVIAALPPVLFWAKIAFNEIKRRKEAEMKEQQRQVMY